MNEDNYERRKDFKWVHQRQPSGKFTAEQSQCMVLQDIRDELKDLNSLLHCFNFTQMPHTLNAIRRNTARPRKKKAKSVDQPKLRVVGRSSRSNRRG